MVGTTLGLVAGALELLTSARWFYLMQHVRIPKDRRAFYGAHATAIALGIAALGVGAPPVARGFAVVAILGALTALGLAAQARQASLTPAVAVGGPVLDFVLPDDTGRAFDLGSLRGRPFLLKFFRGHW
jgi:hypothetical protein